MNRVAFNSTPLSLLWLMFCAMINASDPTFHLFCGFKYPPSCFCVCWKMKMQIRSMKQVNFVNSSIHYSGLKYPPSCFSVYLENKNAYLKQETSEIVVKSIHHGGLLFNCIIINLKSSENKERWRLSTISNIFIYWFLEKQDQKSTRCDISNVFQDFQVFPDFIEFPDFKVL